jgi:16S rRNA (uracil1498-N3)-methyltransferase
MPRFFADFKETHRQIEIEGNDAHHLKNVLRVKAGERITVCNGKNLDAFCVVERIDANKTLLSVEKMERSKFEPTVQVSVFQGILKGDGNEICVAQSVEMGATKYVPVEFERCVANWQKAETKKTLRLQSAAKTAAMQCGRGIIPEAGKPIGLNELAKEINEKFEQAFVFYEGGGEDMDDCIITKNKTAQIALIMGPEGGLSRTEVETLKAAGAKVLTLGPRILRAVTVPVTALTAVMLLTGNMTATN